MTPVVTDQLVTYVLLNACDPPDEIMLEWQAGTDAEHRAFWGGNDIAVGTQGINGYPQERQLTTIITLATTAARDRSPEEAVKLGFREASRASRMPPHQGGHRRLGSESKLKFSSLTSNDGRSDEPHFHTAGSAVRIR